MEAQIESAIDLAWNPSSDQNLQQQAFNFLNQLRADPQAWQVCATLFTRFPKRSDVVRLVCLDVLNNVVHTRNLDRPSLISLKEVLLNYVRQAYGPGASGDVDSTALQNKLTQTFTYLFAALYQEGWESFIDDFLALTAGPGTGRMDNVQGAIMYLRVLGSVHDEIADMLLSRQGDEMKRNTDLKDMVRNRDMLKIAESWQSLLQEYGNRNDDITEMTLKTLGKWVSWADISLIINQNMLNMIFPLIGRTNAASTEDRVRDAAIDAFREMVAKRMKPAEKTELISILNLREVVATLINSQPLREFKGTPKYDTDLAEAVANLVNTTVTAILEDGNIGRGAQGEAERQLSDFLPFLLRFFADEYDEVCSTVIPAITDLLSRLRSLVLVAPGYKEMLPDILNAIILKMRYDETAQWGNEDEQTDEAEFQELRKRLQNLQRSVAAADPDLYMEILSNLVATTFHRLGQEGSQMDWRDLDLALHEMYLFGELALPNTGLGTKSQPNPVAGDRLAAMMSSLVESGIANFPHPAVLLQYMEICVRYAVFFEAHPAYIPQVLENFIRLVHHDHVRIKTRSWYLFHRFVKTLRGRVGNVAEMVIQSIADLLPIKAEVSNDEADDDMSSDESDHSADAMFTSQLYLFEAVGCISSTIHTPIEKQALYARSVIDPLFIDMEQHLPRAKSGDTQAILQVHHVIMALGTLANGFTESQPGAAKTQRSRPHKAVSDEFSRAAEAILVALSELNSIAEIRTACRSAFSRLLGVLGVAILPQLPQWIEGLLSQSSSKDEMALFLRLLEQVVFEFKGEISTVLNLLLTPLLQRIFAGLSEPVFGTDDEIQLAELRREYLSFISTILAHDLGAVLISETNQPIFDSLISSILTLARTISRENLPASRQAFAVMARMSSIWGGPDVVTIAKEPSWSGSQPQPVIPGFDRFMLDRFNPVAWEVLRDPTFRPSADAQTRQVLNELAGLEQMILTKVGNLLIETLQQTVFGPLQIDAESFKRALSTNTDRKAFAAYLQSSLAQWR